MDIGVLKAKNEKKIDQLSQSFTKCHLFQHAVFIDTLFWFKRQKIIKIANLERLRRKFKIQITLKMCSKLNSLKNSYIGGLGISKD